MCCLASTVVVLRAFPLFLRGVAADWYDQLSGEVYGSAQQLEQAFLAFGVNQPKACDIIHVKLYYCYCTLSIREYSVQTSMNAIHLEGQHCHGTNLFNLQVRSNYSGVGQLGGSHGNGKNYTKRYRLCVNKLLSFFYFFCKPKSLVF